MLTFWQINSAELYICSYFPRLTSKIFLFLVVVSQFLTDGEDINV